VTEWYVEVKFDKSNMVGIGGELSYLAPLGSEDISAPYFKQCFLGGGGEAAALFFSALFRQENGLQQESI